MKSYQNAALLQNLYRLKAMGFSYCDPVIINTPMDEAELPEDLDALHVIIKQCHLCDLAKVRRNSLHGFGPAGATLMMIDDYVSLAQDESGDYFAGRAGTSLHNMITKVLELPPNSVYLTHAVKCKAAGSNHPSSSECSSCKPYWQKEIDLVRPRVIVTLGPDAYQMVSGDKSPFEQVRGHRIDFRHQSTLIPLYHPQFLLRNPSLKREALFDLQNIKELL